MRLQDMLDECLDTDAGRIGRVTQAQDYPLSGLPASVLDWPNDWRQRFSEPANVIKKLIPICELYAEAAAEIAVRCEYSRQVSERS